MKIDLTPFVMLLGTAGNEVRDFYPVLAATGADPWVIRHDDGLYYLTCTTAQNITLWRSATISGLGGGERRIVWTPPKSGPNSKNIWAPELHRFDGKWYLYYAADDGQNANHRMYVLENESTDPFLGEFKDKGKIAPPDQDHWAIDGTVLSIRGRRYFLWSGWEGTENIRQNIYIAPMSNPWTISGPRVEISRPTKPWEMVGQPNVNEAPQVLVRGDSVHIIDSASGSWTDDYCLGRLSAKIDSDLLSPSSWKKHDKPVFQSGNGVFGPGHCSFVKSPDGKEDWVIYHAAKHRGAGWTRNIRTQKFDWNADGTPRFGKVASPRDPIALPGGEPRRRRYEAEQGTRFGTASIVRDQDSSGRASVGTIDMAESAVEFDVTTDEQGPHFLSIRYANRDDKKATARHRLSVNGKKQDDVPYEFSGKQDWSNAIIQVELSAGKNKIRLAHGQSVAAIDCIDLVPVPQSKPKPLK